MISKVGGVATQAAARRKCQLAPPIPGMPMPPPIPARCQTMVGECWLGQAALGKDMHSFLQTDIHREQNG